MVAAHRHALPIVDEGDLLNTATGNAWKALARELSPTPGRLGNTLRMVVLVLVTAFISETFRLPEAALSCYVVLFLSRAEGASTIVTALVSGIAVMLAILLVIVVFMASLAEPALRLPLIAGATFLAMFLSRTSPLGPALFGGGFIVAYGLTLGDEVLQLSLAPGTVANTADFQIPELAFIPPEEALVHFLLWLALAVALPVALLIVANLLTGREPGLLLRAALADRLAAAAGFCAGHPEAGPQLEAFARDGTAELAKLHRLSGLLHRSALRLPFGDLLIEEINRLCLALLAWSRIVPAKDSADGLASVLEFCTRAECAIRTGTSLAPAVADDAPLSASNLALPLATRLSRTILVLGEALSAPAESRPVSRKANASPQTPKRLLAPDAFIDPAHVRFALKVTLAVMLCYLGETLVDWPGIHTCIITCFFVSLGSVGESLHKMTLRISGCLIGAALGVGTIIWMMPVMTDIVDLLVALGIVTLLAGWVGSGGERTSYAGWQIGLAYYLTILQGFGPTLDMETARDRIVGILIGNVVVFVIFSTMWPVKVGGIVRGRVVKALEQLAAILELEGRNTAGTDQPSEPLWREFEAAITQARAVLVNDPFEGRLLGVTARSIDAGVVAEVQALGLPISIISGDHLEPAFRTQMPPAVRDAVIAHQYSLANWFRRCAEWVRSGTGADEIMRTLPPRPTADGLGVGAGLPGEFGIYLQARAGWYGVLDHDIRGILDQVAPGQAKSASQREPALVVS